MCINTALKSDITAFLVNGAKRSLVPLAHPQIVTIARPFLEFPVKQVDDKLIGICICTYLSHCKFIIAPVHVYFGVVIAPSDQMPCFRPPFWPTLALVLPNETPAKQSAAPLPEQDVHVTKKVMKVIKFRGDASSPEIVAFVVSLLVDLSSLTSMHVPANAVFHHLCQTKSFVILLTVPRFPLSPF